MKNTDGVYSLSKVMAAACFILLMAITITELVTDLEFSHYSYFAGFTTGLITLSTGRSIMNERNGIGLKQQ